MKLWDVGEAKCLADVLSTDGIINCCCIVSTPNVEAIANPREVSFYHFEITSR